MDTEQEKFEQVSDQELFDGSNEPKEAPEPVKAEEPTEARARDDKGRFVAKEAEAPTEVQPEPEPAPEPEQPREDKPDHIPSWRLKEEADARREAIARAEAAERQAMQFQSALAEMQRQMEAAKPQPAVPDMFADPDAFLTHIRQEMASIREEAARQRKADLGQWSLDRAHERHGDLFKEAYDDIFARMQAGDAATTQAVLSSNNPGETIVELYKREKIARETGGDLQSWLEKQKEDWLKDPAVQARVLEAAKVTARTQPTKIDLPPSLNKAPAAAPAVGGPVDGSDGSVWEHTLR